MSKRRAVKGRRPTSGYSAPDVAAEKLGPPPAHWRAPRGRANAFGQALARGMSTELDPLVQAASFAEARYRESLSKDHLEEAIQVWDRVIGHHAFSSVRLEIRRATLETVSILLIENDDSPRASTLLRRAEAEALRELLDLNLDHALALVVPTVPYDIPGYPRM